MKPARVFPALTDNVLAKDVFTINTSNANNIGRFTHVIGNPPWGHIGKRSGRANVPHGATLTEQRRASLGPALAFLRALEPTQCPVTNKRLSELFVWKTHRDFLAPNGVLGLLISTRSFVGRTAHAFPNALAKQLRVVGIANMSHFRYRLFRGARNPALAIFARAKPSPRPFDATWVYSPLLTSQPIGKRGHLWSIIVSELDIEYHRLRDLTRAPDGWFAALMLRPIDRRFANYLKLWAARFDATFGTFLHKARLTMGRGGTDGQTGLPRGLLLSATDYRERLGSADYPHDRVASSVPNAPFAKMFSGNIVLVPRHMNEVVFVRQPIAFVSSFNAIYYADAQIRDKRRIAALQGVARFLDSDVARYLYALFGKTRLLDRARVEKKDLAALPFPFGQVAADELPGLEGLSEDELTRLFANKVGLDEAFVEAAREYADFRHDYEDAQIPNSALTAPQPESVVRYRATLVRELTQRFGPEAEIEERLSEPTGGERFAHVDIRIARKAAAGRTPESRREAVFRAPPAGAAFSPHANIVYYPQTSCAAVAKPWTRAAWTVERAYADACAIAEKVLRSGRPDQVLL